MCITEQSKWMVWGMAASVFALGPCLHGQVPIPATNLPAVLLLATDPSALEGTSSGAFTLMRFGPNTNELTVSLGISGSASNGVDYATIKDTATIPTGSQAVDILVAPIVDTNKPGNKTVVLTVRTNADYRIEGEKHATVRIIDDVFDIPAPTVSLTSPTNGSAFDDPASITLRADASDSGVAIKSVSFYANDTFLGQSSSSPYSLVWTNPQGGRYTLFARALNQVGESTLSAPVQITVTDAVPVVTITSPTNGMNFVLHDNITIRAEASDSDDAIQSVSFYANDHFLGAVTNAPYSLVWSNAPAGRFFLRAKAVDKAGDRGYSKPVLINVSWMPLL